ncbi:1-acyl-sn-glycerol-3-phosphate acyltransferase alpha-like [Uranotaenia lowii]|uniref:1-acyl-sn-glycerol-3-phosphate acyltransferase alpha-like n=1 Tax=Uranotaenia lowii TaxID=190385 RepID=UPI00247A925B|nr:1-acyl-sn-glycerol-3-phosphate acyltransferase alpha-like [Uranotaenia lowii]
MDALLEGVQALFLENIFVQVFTGVILLSWIWPTFRYYTKLGSVLFVAFLVLVVPIPYFVLRPRRPLNALVPGIVAYKFIELMGVEYEIRGKENINIKNGGVAIINHQSAIDVILLARLLRVFRNIVPVVKKELIYAFPFGIGSYLVGVVFINRKNTASAKNVMAREAVAINRDNLKLAIFPEGTRHDRDTLLPFKKGAFHVAVATQSVIQPIVISKYHFLDHKKRRFGTGRIIVKVFPEISTKGLTKDDINDLVDQCHRKMEAEFIALSEEVKPYCHL